MMRSFNPQRFSATSSPHLLQQQLNNQNNKITKDLSFKRRVNFADARKRLVVLVDSDIVSVQTYFTKVEPLIQTINNHRNHNQIESNDSGTTGNVVLLHRLFFQQSVLKPEWQQVIFNRHDNYESFRVQRFIATHLQMVADAAHIAQLRLQNRTQGIVFVTDQTVAPLYVDQVMKKRAESFNFVDKYVVSGDGGGFALKSEIGK